MSKKAKRNLLIISISLLILAIVAFKYTKSLPPSDEEEGKVTVASVIKEKTIEASHAVSMKIKEEKEKIEKRKEEKRLQKELQEMTTETIPVLFPTENNSAEQNESLVMLIGHQIYTAVDGKRYVTTYKSSSGIMQSSATYNEIPDSVGDVTFRTVEDKVYASKAAKLYGNPQFEGGALLTAGKWEEFTRVGISKDCCYQLVTKSGEIVYGDGLYFRRYREDMELTEDIQFKDERVTLDVKYISQNPTLPTGCEITSLTTVLNYMGYTISKEKLSDDYLDKKPVGEANFYEEFVGNPRNSSSYGCYAGAIVKAANKYLEEQGAMEKAVDYTGCSFADVLWKVREGKPAIVWVTTPISCDPGYTTEWIVNGEYLVWKGNLHCVVVTGYDTYKDKIIVSDPLYGIKEYDMELFIKRYKQFYSQTVIIE